MKAEELIQWVASAPIPASLVSELIRELGYRVPLGVSQGSFAGIIYPEGVLPCPRCGDIQDGVFHGDYCPHCGQALLFDEDEEED